MNNNNPNNYSNFNATMAIAKASLRSILRSPSAVVFSLLFPLIFIVVFANIGGGGVVVDVGVAKGSDTLNPIYKVLKQSKVIKLITKQSEADMLKNLKKGSIDAEIRIIKNSLNVNPLVPGMPQHPPFTVDVKYSAASMDKGNILKSILNSILFQMNTAGSKMPPPVAELKQETISGREYKYIDFILPGQLGFSLLSTGVFGTAFVFLSLRQTLVIKRFFATPVKKYSIVGGEMIARISFALLGAIFIIMIGHFVFGFTLIHGWITVLNMLVLAIFGLIVFMGFGFTISGLAKNESSIPPLSNIITLPQFLLSGTFFSTSAFPKWLQPISNVLPLTHLNDAMRKVAFEGAGLNEVTHQLLILALWGVGIYAVAIKTFKWEA
ncbi:ABC transporter permease [Mucilaginibacter sp. RS28]|uniref:Transport permease protein n=1 Tax=Mucilaginibacter straminoryzae TaxID=2932774 RepID=A0A9X2BAI6_9SPHI|nr:ABC transporter permease [Mucilaginibacter straminoryzae]MCJ8211426.1 ABC transporter permease [Mucilaginibacter straminoryzae]